MIPRARTFWTTVAAPSAIPRQAVLRELSGGASKKAHTARGGDRYAAPAPRAPPGNSLRTAHTNRGSVPEPDARTLYFDTTAASLARRLSTARHALRRFAPSARLNERGQVLEPGARRITSTRRRLRSRVGSARRDTRLRDRTSCCNAFLGLGNRASSIALGLRRRRFAPWGTAQRAGTAQPAGAQPAGLINRRGCRPGAR